ncbi:CPBP family intramembrane metalloprotease, partial [Clostridium perfringens]
LLGVQSIIFIVLGLTLNTWSTTDATLSPYNMLYPWLFPLMAWLAGISEEAVYRLFGIKLVKKIVRKTFVASLITSLIWALGHTLYPIYPVISRPIELVIIGLLFSYIFLKYGYLAAMFSHVIFNSILMGISLILLKDTTNLLIGAFYMVLPALVAYAIY